MTPKPLSSSDWRSSWRVSASSSTTRTLFERDASERCTERRPPLARLARPVQVTNRLAGVSARPVWSGSHFALFSPPFPGRIVSGATGQGQRDQLGRVQRTAAGVLFDLLPAGEAVRHDQLTRAGRADGGQQPAL